MEKPKPCCDLSSWLRPELFKALADPNRAAILARLATCDSEQSVSQVASCCPVDLSVVSRHLALLRAAGVVSSERRGKEVYYRLRVTELVRLLRGFADALEACCPEGGCAVMAKPESEEIDE